MGVLITESTDLGTLDDRLANLAAKHDVRIGLAVMVHRDRWEVRAKFESEGREGLAKSKEWGTLAEAINESLSLLAERLGQDALR